MSIDATVWDVTRDNGNLKLWLKDRDAKSIAGQASLLVVGECHVAESLVGRDVWAPGSGPLMCGDTQIGERIGYTRCKLRSEAIEAITDGSDKP